MICDFKKIYFLGLLVCVFFTPKTQAAIPNSAKLLIDFPKLEVYTSDYLSADVYLESGNQCLNLVKTSIKFSNNIYKATDFIESTSGQFMWIEALKIDNNQGYISFALGIPKGFCEKIKEKNKIKIGQILFSPIGNSKFSLADFSFQEEGTRVFLNDGKASLTSINLDSKSLKLLPVTQDFIITSVTHPDQGSWNKLDSSKLILNKLNDFDYSYTLNLNKSVEPDEIIDQTNDINFNNLDDGVYYFTVISKPKAIKDFVKSNRGTYRIMIDKKVPDIIKIDNYYFDNTYQFFVKAQDNLSGINKYQIKIKNQTWRDVLPMFTLSKQDAGQGFDLRVVDKAGNERLMNVSPLLTTNNYFKICMSLLLIILANLAWLIVFIKQVRKVYKNV